MSRFIHSIGVCCLAVVLAGCNLSAEAPQDSLSAEALSQPDSPLLNTPDGQSFHEATPQGGTTSDCLVTTTRLEEVYDAPGAWGNIIGRLDANGAAPGVGLSSSGWVKIQYATGMGWIPSNLLQQSPACASLPVEGSNPPVTGCQASNSSGEARWIYGQKNVLDNLLARFAPGSVMPVTAQSEGWIQVYVEAFSAAGWVEAQFVTLSGSCDNVPQR